MSEEIPRFNLCGIIFFLLVLLVSVNVSTYFIVSKEWTQSGLLFALGKFSEILLALFFSFKKLRTEMVLKEFIT